MAKKKTNAKKSTEQLRKEAIKDIDKRLDGDQKKPAKKDTAASKTAKAPKANDPKPKRLSGLDAAAQVLAEAGKPLDCLDIMEAIIKKRLWGSLGKTPHATLSAAMSREITKKGKDSRFVKAGRGLFATTGKAV
ncbi:MAG: winged helix-turn-helix domain-containing protein [Planctomycetota bacterium]|nr:winged helix-turn-helix domain-containing protein [Planctomycetota bacterium]